MQKSIFISAGDFSGDILAGRLAAKFIENGWSAVGIGGEKMASSGVKLIENIISKSTIGFIEPLKNIPFFLHLLRKLKKYIKKNKPTAAVVVDFWGFHSLLIKVLASEGVPVYYYVSPQLWASRPGRAKKIKKFVKKVFTVFPFEEEFYRKRRIAAVFVGHPLTDVLPEACYKPASDIFGILPGSRPSEVARHLPLLIRISEILKKEFRFRFVCFKAPSLNASFYTDIPAFWELIEDEDYTERKKLKFAICSSGTATFENALLGIPMAIIYKTSHLSYFIAKKLVKTNFIGMPNILLKEEVVPEFIQNRAEADIILPVLENMLKENNLARVSEKLMTIRKILEKKKAETTVFNEISGETR